MIITQYQRTIGKTWIIGRFIGAPLLCRVVYILSVNFCVL